MTECVYFIQAGKDGPVKIGWTAQNVSARLAQLKTASSEPLRLIGFLPGGRDTEASFHERFSQCRIQGEWFRADEAMLAEIKRVASSREEYSVPSKPEPDRFTAEAAVWARYIEDRAAQRARRPIVAVRPEVAAEIGVSHGLLENLRRSRVEAITAIDHDNLRAAYLTERKKELAEMCALLDGVEGEAATLIEKAKELIHAYPVNAHNG